jgi:hypothetical protein
VAGLCREIGVALPGDGTPSEELRARGVEALLDCSRDGVFGVPMYLYGHQKFWGVDRVDRFLAELTGPEATGWAPDEPTVQRAVPAADHGHAGGCG